MNKRTILSGIFILSVIVALFSLILGSKLVYEFKSSIIEFTTPFELKIESGSGMYDLFVLSSKSDKEEHVDHVASKNILSPLVIKTKEGSIIPINYKDAHITYILFDNVYKKIGSFEIDGEQTISIESNAKNGHFEQLTYAKEGSFVRFFDIMKYGLFFLLSVGAGLVSGISLIILKRNKRVIANIAE